MDESVFESEVDYKRSNIFFRNQGNQDRLFIKRNKICSSSKKLNLEYSRNKLEHFYRMIFHYKILLKTYKLKLNKVSLKFSMLEFYFQFKFHILFWCKLVLWTKNNYVVFFHLYFHSKLCVCVLFSTIFLYFNYMNLFLIKVAEILLARFYMAYYNFYYFRLFYSYWLGIIASTYI